MFVRSALVAFVTVAAPQFAFAEIVGELSVSGPSAYSLSFSKDVREETKIVTKTGTHVIGSYPVFVSYPITAWRVPRFRDSFFVNLKGTKFQSHAGTNAIVIFGDKVFVLRDGTSTTFDLPRKVDGSTDINAFHTNEAESVAIRAGGRTQIYTLTKDGDFRTLDVSLSPHDIKTVVWNPTTEKVVMNGAPLNSMIMPLTKPVNPKPFRGEAAQPVNAERVEQAKSAFEEDAARRAADAKAGIVDLRDHNAELLAKAVEAAGPMTFKDKDDQMVDLATFMRSNFSFVEKVQRNEIDQAAFEKEVDLATTGLLMAQGGSVRVTGSAGVGKSHFQDTLLAAIFSGKTSPALTNRLYIRLTAAQLGGGTKFVGTMEERVNALKKLAEQVPLVLMIDEIHSLVGQGTHSGSNNDFFQFIKEELATGKIKIVGMTTTNEWEKHIASDQALASRFSIHVKLEEPSAEKLVTILENFKATRHLNSKLSVSKEQLSAIAALATRFDPIDANPRKSIRLFDFILARAERSGATSISSASIVKDASLLYNYDIGALTPDKIRTRIVELNKHLDSKLVGLEEAKTEVFHSVADYFVTQKSNANSKPYGIILYGDAGAGKTELAKQTAAGLGFKFNRVMMGDYATQQSAEDFKTKLALAIKANPFQVLLLDEVEKAHASVQAVLLRVMDEGRLSAKISEFSTTESEIDASKLLIFAATNAARDLPGQPHSKQLFREVTEHDGFNRYLLDRFTVTIGLPRAPVANVYDIMKMKAKDMLKQLQDSGYRVTANLDEVAQHLLMRVQPTIVSHSENKNPIGFAFAPAQSDPTVEVRFSVRELEAELQGLKRSISTHIVMNDAHSVDLHFNKQGTLEMRAGAPICIDLFTRR